MAGSMVIWKGIYKAIEIIVVIGVLAWLICPYPYTWDEIAVLYPSFKYGYFIPLWIYVMFTGYRKIQEFKARRAAVNEPVAGRVEK